VMLAQALLMRQAGQSGSLSIAAEAPYPAIGDDLAEKVRSVVAGWLHRPDLDLQWILRDTRLLSWTYKPAWTVQELQGME